MLDAGCGTGRYARELARLGYIVEGADIAPDLIAVANSATPPDNGGVSFRLLDLLEIPRRRYDGILCRGVLNDVDGHCREHVFNVFADSLRGQGVLVMDVRDWHQTRQRKAANPVFRKSVATDRGMLTFTSVTTLDPEDHSIRLLETHTLATGDSIRSAEYEFHMHCWTRAELRHGLNEAGFGDVHFFGAYDAATEVGTTDRIVAVASLRN